MQSDTNSCVHQRLGQWLVNLLLDNKRYRVVVEDVGYDRSTRPVRSDDGFRLDDYKTVRDLLDNEYTGRTVATYCSGSGLAAETLHEAAVDVAGDALHEWLDARLPGIFDFGGDITLSQNLGFDSDTLCEALADINSEYGFVEVFEEQSLGDVFNKHFSAALALRSASAEKAQADALERQRISELLEARGRWLLVEWNFRWQGRRFESATAAEFWEELERLRKSGKAVNVAAALRLSGQAFSLSNSVRQDALSKFVLSI